MRRKKLHPIIREIARREREIAKLRQVAEMLGIEAGATVRRKPKAKISKKQAADYYHRLALSQPAGEG